MRRRLAKPSPSAAGPRRRTSLSELVTVELAPWLLGAHGRRRSPLAVGICGAPGSGKSTAAAALRVDLEARGLRVAALSLDDLYLTRSERQRLAGAAHPLFLTRGPPGTHDLDLAHAVLDGVLGGANLRLPAFDKAADDRRPETQCPWFEGPADILLLEGWCVGARPQAQGDLSTPVNALERDEDPDGAWRRAVNDALGGYQRLFDRLDLLVLLQAPDFDVVPAWRAEQEAGLLAAGADPARLMDAEAIGRFVQYYERLTRHILGEMPSRADVVVRLGPSREVLEVDIRRDDLESAPAARETPPSGP